MDGGNHAEGPTPFERAAASDGAAMKVALFKSAFAGPSDGSGETLVSYATQLAATGHDVTVVLTYPSSTDDQYTSRLEMQGVRLEYLSTGKTGYGLQFLRKVALKIARNAALMELGRVAAEHLSALAVKRYRKTFRTLLVSRDIEVIHVLGISPGISAIVEIAQTLRVAVLFHELGLPEDGPMATSYHTRLRTALSCRAHVAALSPALAAKCREIYRGVDEIVILPLIVEDLGYSPLSNAAQVTFGFSGRIDTMKGVMTLAEAFTILRRYDPSAHLRIAGLGRQEGAMTRKLEDDGAAGHCEFVGAYTRPEGKRAFMHSLDVLVHPSLTEGTPNTIVEAMSAGLPIIATAVGGIPDMVCAHCAILVPADDPWALADAMERLARDPALRRRMGAAGRLRYERYFSAESVAHLLLRRYRSASSVHRSPCAATTSVGNSHPWADVAV